MYQFVESQQGEHSIALLCETIQISRSAWYAWYTGESYRINTADMQQEDEVRAVFQAHRRRYGARRIVAELQAQGVEIGYHRVRSIMKKLGLNAIKPRSFIPRTTDSRHNYPISPNLLLDSCMPSETNSVWVGDITYIPVYGGQWAYLAVWMDLFSRRIIGWHLADHMREELIVSAFRKALSFRRIAKGMIIHSDRGGQYAGKKFRKLLADRQLWQSMSRANDPYDNAFMESCFSRFKTELLEGGMFENIADAHTEIFEYIEMYYNPIRRHSSLQYLSPINFEAEAAPT
jgi:transposase InsO family protein